MATRDIGSAVNEMVQPDYPDIPLCSTAKARYPESHADHEEFGFARRGQSSVNRETVILGGGGHARVVAGKTAEGVSAREVRSR